MPTRPGRRCKVQAQGRDGSGRVGPGVRGIREAKDVKDEMKLAAPEDPKLLDMVHEAQQVWEEDQKRSVVLYRLAARKGYPPALVLLSNNAQKAGDNELAIESLVSLLLHPDSPAQIAKKLMDNYAVELAMLLRDERYADYIREHQQDLNKLSERWPVLQSAASTPETQDAISVIKQLCTAPANIVKPPVDHDQCKKDADDALQAIRQMSGASAVKHNDASDGHGDIVQSIRRMCSPELSKEDKPKADSSDSDSKRALDSIKQLLNNGSASDASEALEKIKQLVDSAPNAHGENARKADDHETLLSSLRKCCNDPDEGSYRPKAKADASASDSSEAFDAIRKLADGKKRAESAEATKSDDYKAILSSVRKCCNTSEDATGTHCQSPATDDAKTDVEIMAAFDQLD
eukprot:TRINITY_DN28159_c0_g3_i1.p1 TRINITY_DN28159_c0_g3~~TRINITY_DN28159_c0_g3_i1.p1  ORF type:complete len:434 (-),score=88.29 TRINITY_DN28159_c0_g3_i1:72-1286(-)